MTTALLVVIVLILLFGAGVVKGWLANVAGLGCGGIIILMSLLWLGSLFGENGFAYIVYGIMGLLAVLLLVGLAIRERPREGITQTPGPSKPVIEQQPPAPVEIEQRDRVWAWFAEDIALRFTPEARERATQLYEANDVIELDRFCRGQRNNPYR